MGIGGLPGRRRYPATGALYGHAAAVQMSERIRRRESVFRRVKAVEASARVGTRRAMPGGRERGRDKVVGWARPHASLIFSYINQCITIHASTRDKTSGGQALAARRRTRSVRSGVSAPGTLRRSPMASRKETPSLRQVRSRSRKASPPPCPSPTQATPIRPGSRPPSKRSPHVRRPPVKPGQGSGSRPRTSRRKVASRCMPSSMSVVRSALSSASVNSPDRANGSLRRSGPQASGRYSR